MDDRACSVDGTEFLTMSKIRDEAVSNEVAIDIMEVERMRIDMQDKGYQINRLREKVKNLKERNNSMTSTIHDLSAQHQAEQLVIQASEQRLYNELANLSCSSSYSSFQYEKPAIFSSISKK